MIRTMVKPDKLNISITLPENYVGKQVEVIAFTVAEATKTTPASTNNLIHFASEKSLAKDWLTKKEDAAWQDL